MQPYIFPYLGYFQLINAVDKFVVYDNIQFTKKGWINRNRILVNSKDEYFTLPLKKDSDYLNVDERQLADTFSAEKIKLLRKIKEAYKKSPSFESAFPVIETIINQQEDNLFKFIYQSLISICKFLEIKTEFIVSSSIPVNHTLKSQDKVIAICRHLQASNYINPIGGVELYSKDIFIENNIELNFIKSNSITYQQYKSEFIPSLSIIDMMMFNSKEKIQEYLQSGFTII